MKTLLYLLLLAFTLGLFAPAVQAGVTVTTTSSNGTRSVVHYPKKKHRKRHHKAHKKQTGSQQPAATQ
jgi:hypothetical protein